MENNQYDKIQGMEILIGSIGQRPYAASGSDKNLQRTDITLQSTYGAANIINSSYTGYSGIAVMSLDGLLRPVSMSGMDGLPRYGKFTFDTTLMKSGPVSPVPPLLRGTGGTTGNLQYNVEISRDFLNPFTNPTGRGLSFSRRHEQSGTGGKGHDIDLVGHPTGLPSGYSMTTSYGDGNGNESYSNDIKFMALRGPLVVQGWGYDTNSKPIPNAADTYSNAIQGIFTASNLKDTFMPDFLQKSSTWPVGPVDLRWDRKRGVWTSPQPYRFMHVRLLDTIHSLQGGNPNTNISGARARVPYTIDTFYDSSGNTMSAGTPSARPEILVYDRTNTIHPSGSDVLCYYDTVEEKYYILNGYNDAIKYSIVGQTGWRDKTIDANYSITGNINVGNSTTPTGIIDFTSDNGTSDYDVPIFGGEGIGPSEGLAIKRTIGGKTKYEVIKQYNRPSNTVFFRNARPLPGTELGQSAYLCDIEAIDGAVTTSGVVLANTAYGNLSGFNGIAHLYPIGFVSNNSYSGFYRYKYEPITLTLLGKQSCTGGTRTSLGAETYQTTALVSKNGISLYRDNNSTTGNIGLSIDVKNFNNLFDINIYNLASDDLLAGTGLSTPKVLTNGVVGWDSIVFSKGLKSTYNATSPLGIPNEPGCAMGIMLDITTDVAEYPTGASSPSFGANYTNIYFDNRAFNLKRFGTDTYYEFSKGIASTGISYIKSISIGYSGSFVTGVTFEQGTININTGIGTIVSII
jgi:hypothetical protein